MKIAFIVEKFPTLSETFILNQITGLIDMGHDVEIFSMKKSEENKFHADFKKYDLLAKTHYISMPKILIIRILKSIIMIFSNFHKSPIMIIKSLNCFKYKDNALSLKLFYTLIHFMGKQFDIIHGHFGPNGITSANLKDIGIYGTLVTSFHGYDANALPRLWGKNVYKRLFQVGDFFTCNTNFTKNKIVELGCNPQKIVILPVGLDMKKFKFLKRKYLRGDKTKLLTVGRLVEKKGHKYAMMALAKVIIKNKNIEYLIVGDGPERKNLEKLSSRLKIRKYIKFLGAMNQDEIVKIYGQAHVFILPSVTAQNGDMEGQGLVLQEAQATGMPVVSTLHNGIPEGVVDGKSGFLVPEKDDLALATKIEFLINNPALCLKIGVFGRKFVEKKYNILTLNRRLLMIYKKINRNYINSKFASLK